MEVPAPLVGESGGVGDLQEPGAPTTRLASCHDPRRRLPAREGVVTPSRRCWRHGTEAAATAG